MIQGGGRGPGASINWVMSIAQRNIGPGRLGLRGMFSVEPWSIAAAGIPISWRPAKNAKAEKIHDLQHPHDLFMEVAAEYNAPIAGDLRWQLYAAPAGEPALGPDAYPHRVSADA